VERDTVALVGHKHDLGPERRADELGVLGLGNMVKQAGNGGAVLRVEIGVDLIKDDKGAGLGRLKGKDETEGA
jgi:hypothetical protein